jgi:predicted metal-dependent phosphoesterase TrpH
VSLTDLHLHSNISDGEDSPARLVELTAEAGVSTMALVDHDILDGIAEARSSADALGIELIPGIELSVGHEGKKIHMLVYFLEPGTGPLQDHLEWLRAGRTQRNTKIAKRLGELGYEITMDDVLRHAAGASVGRPHIADALIEKGYFDQRDDVFRGLLSDGGDAYIERERFDAVRAIELARASGGVPVIAHPLTIGWSTDEADEAFAFLASEGLGGIEAHHPMHTPQMREHLEAVAGRLGIAATGGSDYHGATKKRYRIGVGEGDLRVPGSSVEALKAQKGR